MKKVIFVSALLLAVASCGSGTSTKQSTSSTENTGSSSGSSSTMPDTSVTPNQSGSTGNGGVGTGAVNQTGEESSGTGNKDKKQPK
jgi:hypothetical protein